jgi:quercetin dioxygenase-like cupin family protein
MSDGLLGAYSIDTEIERFRPDDTGAGRRAETLIKVDGLRVVLVTMRAGISLHEHVAPGPITIHALRGRFRVTFEGNDREIGPGDLVALGPGIRHAVETIEAGAFLLTIGWGPGAPAA